MKITLWRKPGCPQCDMTEKQFEKRGIQFTVKRLDRSPKAVERFKELGLLSAPIIETDDRRWAGFRLNKIESLEKHLKFERKRGVNVPLEPMAQVADEVEDE